MPMQPRPIAETMGPPRPSLRCFITEVRCSHGVLSPCVRPDRAARLQVSLPADAASSYLSDPDSRCDLFPALPDCFILLFGQWACLQQFRILLQTFRFSRADNGSMHSRHTQSKTQRDGDGFFEIVEVAQKIVVQLSQPFIIFVMVRFD